MNESGFEIQGIGKDYESIKFKYNKNIGKLVNLIYLKYLLLEKTNYLLNSIEILTEGKRRIFIKKKLIKEAMEIISNEINTPANIFPAKPSEYFHSFCDDKFSPYTDNINILIQVNLNYLYI